MYKYRRVIVSVIAGLLILLMVGGLIVNAFAESSSSIQSRIDALKQQEEEISQQKEEARTQRQANESEILDLVEQKNRIDQDIMLTYGSIETKNELILEYNLLIAEKQNELDDAVAGRDALNEQYKLRIRAMEENGKLTYWSVLFRADSFADLLDRVEMINEIARADARMIEQLQLSAQQIEMTRQELAAEKLELEEAKEALADAQAELADQRAEADQLMADLMADHERYAAAEQEYEQQEEALLAQIATAQAEYEEAVAAEEAAAAAYNSTSNSGFCWPINAYCVTCPFGPRNDPLTGEYNNHSGIDIGADYGDPIRACASGTVTTATYSSIFGNYVVIAHGNGFSTLYGHMTYSTVSAGESVSGGEVIGYAGSTGHSSGPHLHLTMYYYGSLVDPLSYLPSCWYFG